MHKARIHNAIYNYINGKRNCRNGKSAVLNGNRFINVLLITTTSS